MICPKPFQFTPRRKQVLWHIAYTEEIAFQTRRYWGPGHWVECLQPTLGGVDIRAICRVLSKHKLICWPMMSDRMWITPNGMDMLLGSIR